MNNMYTKSDIEKILSEEEFEYQRVNLPYGLHTHGSDRSSTSEIIYPKSLEGHSVLDVGTANGYFSFEAESRNADRVVGIDLKEKRLRHARLLKDILRSNVEFRRHNIEEQGMQEEFDYVLLLNVIHHLKEPMSVVRSLAGVTKKKLVIEFPTFSDPKFKEHARLRLSFIFDRLPLIGVSSLADRRTDQTFVFSPLAIKKILMDHDCLFKEINIIDSPIKGRKIAICVKHDK